MTKKFKSIFRSVFKDDNWLTNFARWVKPFIKPVLLVFAISCFSMIAILRTGISYEDDASREYSGGYAFSSHFNRYSASIISYIINTDTILQDLSPLTQIISLLLLSIACVVVIYNLCAKKLRPLTLVISSLIVVSPFMLGCWSFKYDSPGMALAMLSAVLPIVFWYPLKDRYPILKNNCKKLFAGLFVVMSSLSLFIMWTSYQAASGILPVLVIMLVLTDYLRDGKIAKSLKTGLWFAVPYLLAAIAFLVIFPNTSASGYRQTSMPSLSQLPVVFINNLRIYIWGMLGHINFSWKLLAALLVAMFFLSVAFIYRKNGTLVDRTRALFLSLVALVMAFVVSYGAYLILSSPAGQGGAGVTFGRTAMGIGVLLACLALITVGEISGFKAIIFSAPSIVMLYSFIAYAFAFGNALVDQQKWNDFLGSQIISDLTHKYAEKGYFLDHKLVMVGSFGESEKMKFLQQQRPITEQLVNSEGYATWMMNSLFLSYGVSTNKFETVKSISEAPKYCDTSKTTSETYYYTIKENKDGDVCIVMK